MDNDTRRFESTSEAHMCALPKETQRRREAKEEGRKNDRRKGQRLSPCFFAFTIDAAAVATTLLQLLSSISPAPAYATFAL